MPGASSKVMNLFVRSQVAFAFRARPAHSCRISVCDDEIRYVSNDDCTGSDHCMAADNDPVRDAGTDSNRGAASYLNFSSHRNAWRNACKIVNGAVVVNRTARIDNAEFPYSRPRSDVGPGENDGANTDFGRRRYYSGRMLDNWKLHFRTETSKFRVHPAPLPVVPNCYYQEIKHLLGANGGGFCQITKYRVTPAGDTKRQSIVQISRDAVFSR